MADQNTPTELPEDKDLQDHTFGLKAEQIKEEAGASGAGQDERDAEPHAGGKA
jgi:hypothetical protein